MIRAADEAAEAWLENYAVSRSLQIVRLKPEGSATALAELALEASGSGYLVRPDGRVAARWKIFEPQAFATAHERLLGKAN